MQGFKKILQKGIKLLSVLTIVILLYLSISTLLFVNYSKDKIYSYKDDFKSQSYALVLGAGVDSKGKPMDMLKDRLDTAADLYESKKVEYLILSGDNRGRNNGETDAMSNYLINERSIPKEDLIIDPYGRRTYDSCARLADTEKYSKLIIITQNCHLPRSVFLCEKLGIDSIGVSANQKYKYKNESFYMFREVLAIQKALIDIYLVKPDYIKE